jgi:uncharacterized membrane protein
MPQEHRISSSFRKTLRDELARWREEGLLSAEQADRLAARYRLGDLARESSGALLAAVYIIGTILIAGGIISFVAYHWQIIPAAVQVVLILAAMLAAHGLGIWFWKVRDSRPRLGHALVVLGTLIFGANIGLMAQIFNLSSHYYNGFGAWALGALAMAYAVRSVPSAFVAVVASFVWFCGWNEDSGYAATIYPLAAAAAFLPFIWRERSAIITLLALLAIGLPIVVNAADGRGVVPWAMPLASAAVGGLYTAAGLAAMRRPEFARLGRVAVALGVVAIGVPAYVLSFLHVAEDMRRDAWSVSHWTKLIPAGVALAGAAAGWVLYAARWRKDAAMRPLAAGLLAAMVLLAAATVPSLVHTDAMPHGRALTQATDIVAAALANLSVLALAAGLAASGVAWQDRRVFWPGVVAVVVLVLSRFFEYDTDLLAKAAGFLACGLGLILGGVRFETYLRARRPADAGE